MNKQQVLDVIRKIELAYSHPWTRNKSPLHKDKTEEEIILEVVNTWHEFLKDCDAERVFERLNHHIMTSKFPPTVSEIYAPKQPESKFLDKYERWEREARNAKRKQYHRHSG